MNRRDPLAGLHVFRQVADTGSFTRAAALLGVTPAAVSQAINQLEAELRLKLFHRTTRGVSLSEAGQRYHEQTEQPYRDLVRAREALGESLAEPSGQLRISALHLAKNLVIAPMLNEFVRRYPKVQLEIRYEDQLVDIVRERLDAGIRLADALQPGMVGVQLTAPLACLLVATPAYLAEYGTPASVADLDGHAAVRFRFPRSGRLHKWRLREDGRELEVDLPARFVSTRHRGDHRGGPRRRRDRPGIHPRAGRRGPRRRAPGGSAAWQLPAAAADVAVLPEPPPRTGQAARLHRTATRVAAAGLNLSGPCRPAPAGSAGGRPVRRSR